MFALAMAQIASAFPTAGGLYHWASILGGRFWGWLTAWLNLLGLMPHLFAAHASANPDDVDTAAAGFHLAFADALASWAESAAQAHGCTVVCLGGGCFANRILRKRVTARLQSAGFAVLSPRVNSCGDAGLALGQAWVAQRQLMRGAVPLSPLKEFEPCV